MSRQHTKVLVDQTIDEAINDKEANVGLYRHYGVDLMKEELIPKTPVTHYAMVRNPIDENEPPDVFRTTFFDNSVCIKFWFYRCLKRSNHE